MTNVYELSGAYLLVNSTETITRKYSQKWLIDEEKVLVEELKRVRELIAQL